MKPEKKAAENFHSFSFLLFRRESVSVNRSDLRIRPLSILDEIGLMLVEDLYKKESRRYRQKQGANESRPLLNQKESCRNDVFLCLAAQCLHDKVHAGSMNGGNPRAGALTRRFVLLRVVVFGVVVLPAGALAAVAGVTIVASMR
jgi:hypothetical protein